MSYNLRERIPRDYAAMHEGQDDKDEFHDSFQFQPPPAPSSTPFTGPQTSSTALRNDTAALTAAIASLRAKNDALERDSEVAQLQAELHAL